MSEEMIMKEVRARGPVTYDFMAASQFMMYRSGVLMEIDALPAGYS